MSDGRNRIDWPGFCVNFVFGAFFGAVLGFRWWTRSDWALSPSMTPGAVIVSACALVGGLLAGVGKDDFWSGIGEGFVEWPWKMLKVLGYALVVLSVVWLVKSLIT